MTRIFGIFLFIFGLILLLFFWPAALVAIGLSLPLLYLGSRKKCPKCGEWVSRTAKICKYCKEPFEHIGFVEGVRAFINYFKN